MSHEREISDGVPMEDSVQVALRFSFTASFLRGAVLFARQAREVEDTTGNAADEETQYEHRAYVVSAIMQSVAALEAEISEVIRHGPGHHLSSNGTDVVSRDFLRSQADIIEREAKKQKKTPTLLYRYDRVLDLLKKPALNRGALPYQDAALLVKLRNEIVHYESQWGQEMERKNLFQGLENLRFEKPPFITSNQNFFPYHILSASCTSWAASTATEFINMFYSLLGFSSPLEAHMAALSSVPPVRYRNNIR